MKYCDKCSKEFDDGMKFCPLCGNMLTAKNNNCSNCGKEIVGDFKFCPYCGTEVVNNMKQEDKEIFMSYYYYAKSIKEIADTLKIAESKVKSRLFRIRKKLKKVLEKRGYSYHG